MLCNLQFFSITVKIENAILKLELTLPTSDPTTVNYAIEMLLVVRDKTINHLSKQSKEPIYLLSFFLIISFS